MGFTLSVNKKIIVAGLNVTGNESVTDDMLVERDSVIPKAQPAILTTRTNGTTGTLTMTNGGHGITTGAIIDLYWAGGYISGVTAGTVSGTSVPISGGNAEFVLSVATTPIIVGIVQVEPFVCTGSNNSALLMGVDNNKEAILSFVTSGTVRYTRHLAAGAAADFWTTLSPWTNPLATFSITHVRMSHADTASVQDMQAAALTH